MKIFTIVGARPNFIKIDPDLPQTIVHTGQHYDYKMSETFFRGLKLPKPKYNLHCTDPGAMIDKLFLLLHREKPDMVIVIGDTNSAMAGAMAASMANIRVAHVEAGLRSYDLSMPEEKNRVVIDKLAYLHFCPNSEAVMNLLKEGIKDNVHLVGDPLFDSMGRFLPIKRTKDYRQYVLLTMHRNFNVDNPAELQSVLETIDASGENVIFPIHPRTKKTMKAFGKKVKFQNIHFIDPVNYKDMLSLISNAKKVITDSGGVQREAFWMNVPVIILRDVTEWTDIVTKNGGILVGMNNIKLLDAIKNFKGRVNSPPEPRVNRRIKEIIYRHV